ncbi:MAG: hypothetical protein Q4D48_04315 [Coriobacteriales bacterium]|nr:hypothetical protein [Coriobacteriales bacterium]
MLADQLPAGAERTDTFVLKPGATAFEPYAKTLSYAPTTNPSAVCSPDGWLYAFAVSDYETSSIFGRATKVATSPTPEPEPEPEPKPEPKPSDDDSQTRQPSSRSTIPQTGDPGFEAPQTEFLLALAGLTCVTFGLAKRRES